MAVCVRDLPVWVTGHACINVCAMVGRNWYDCSCTGVVWFMCAHVR